MNFDLDQLLLRDTFFKPPNCFTPGEDLVQAFHQYCKVLVVGAGGLGCEILKNLALSGVPEIEIIDLDSIELTNLNRETDIGKNKSEVAAKVINERFPSCKVKAHVKKIQEFPLSFYQKFPIIIAGLDNVEARSWLNQAAHDLASFDRFGTVNPDSMHVLIDGGTEGLNGKVNIIRPFQSACYNCLLDTLPNTPKVPLCTIASTPRTADHCIIYAHQIIWNKLNPDRNPDFDNPEDTQFLYQKALERAQQFNIEGVTFSKTLGVLKNIIPVVASTNAIISAICCNEAIKLMSGMSLSLDNYYQSFCQNGINSSSLQMEQKQNCSVCNFKKIKVNPKETYADLVARICSMGYTNPIVMRENGSYLLPPSGVNPEFQAKQSNTIEEMIKNQDFHPNQLVTVIDSSIKTALRCEKLGIFLSD